MVKAGIIDPTKVVRLALQNAASVAGLLVTTEAMVAEKPEKKAAPECRTTTAWTEWTTTKSRRRSRGGRYREVSASPFFSTSQPGAAAPTHGEIVAVRPCQGAARHPY